ncbi:MAG: phosphatidylglycerophosphatase A [Desulfovibrio sp.]|nr:phosphatidylglycerophosphatase A [Desulfovibrio sp.]
MTMSDKCILAFCRLGPAGLSPKAPGTCGTAVACLLAPLLFLPFSLTGRAAILVAVFFAGAWAATRAERILGRKDPGEVVIDELAGVWLVLLPIASPHWWEIAAAFVLFRIFDIWKPWPVHASESWLPDGYGIMIDDILAGCWALLCLNLVRMCV